MNFFQPFVTIIVPIYKDWERLQLCLDALSKQDYPSNRVEVIVVNNEKEPEYPKDLILPSNCKIIHQSNPGSYAARNTGILSAKGEIIGFTDSDCIPEYDWITSAISVFDLNNDIYRVTGPVKLFISPHGSKLAWILESTSAFSQKYNVSKGLSVTANLFIRKSCLEIIGGFNEKLFSGGDFEWNLRANKANLKIFYDESIVVHHPARGSILEIINMYKRTFGGRFRKNQSLSKRLLLLISLLLPPLGSIEVWRVENRKARNILLSFFLLWSLKILLIGEAFRLLLGGHECRK